jgi:Family of unknown function (DUF6421)
MNAAQRKIARVLFDETHSESWSISAEHAREIQPENPVNSSYRRAADALAERDFVVTRHLQGPLDRAALAGTGILALLHPCDPRWERTVPCGAPALSSSETDDVLDFVRSGGGLLLVTENEHAKYGDNLNDLLAPAGLRMENGVVFDRTACLNENPEWIFGEATPDSPIAHGVKRACFFRAGWTVASGDAKIAWKASEHAWPPNAGLIGLGVLGAGRIAVVTDSVLFGDERIGQYDHLQLWLNLLYWLAEPVFRGARRETPDEKTPRETAPPTSRNAPDWEELKGAVNALRTLQSSDGSVPEEDRLEAARLTQNTLDSLAALRPRFPHQTEYLEILSSDFRAWEGGGFARPDFGESLAAFHPECQRTDQREHLALFPLYTPNASGDTRFEALLIRTPWPDWLASLERDAYRNPKFAPGHLVDFTDGYASECAVLFPETVAVARRSSNHFATIFCDREARRLQSIARRAAEAVRLPLFPELACWLGSLPLIEDTTALWDLIHDASHSLGELPFDPFMIRQRAPFWMYGLEELRVDLRSFEEATRLAEQGFPFARYVPWAIILDRVFRFPISGTRVRNYDALGGQLLFAWLHQRDVLIWRDNRLEIRWEALPAGIRALREELTGLYKFGADCSKLTFWITAHDLIAKSVPPHVASRWRAGVRDFDDETDLKKWIALVQPDEFPLGNFHRNLERKLK